MNFETTPSVAGIPIIAGILFLGVASTVVVVLPMWIAALVLGMLVSAAVCYVIIVAMPRATQISLMGVATGVSADAGYAKLNDQTPITVANGLVKLADALTKSVGLIAADAQVSMVAGVTPYFVAAGARASYRFFEFFTANIRNPNTRRAYARGGRILRLACGARRDAASFIIYTDA